MSERRKQTRNNMMHEYPFNHYVTLDKILDICFEGVYNVVVEVRESGKHLAFLHTSTFNIQIAQMAMSHLVSVFPNDSIYIYFYNIFILYYKNNLFFNKNT